MMNAKNKPYVLLCFIPKNKREMIWSIHLPCKQNETHIISSITGTIVTSVPAFLNQNLLRRPDGKEQFKNTFSDLTTDEAAILFSRWPLLSWLSQCYTFLLQFTLWITMTKMVKISFSNLKNIASSQINDLTDATTRFKRNRLRT